MSQGQQRVNQDQEHRVRGLVVTETEQHCVAPDTLLEKSLGEEGGLADRTFAETDNLH